MPLTSLGFLFHKAFLKDQTAFGKGKSRFSIVPKMDETILGLLTDDDQGGFVAQFGLQPKDKRSDLVVVQLKHQQDKIVGHRILFVELKGGHHAEAVDQLDRVVGAVLPKLRPTFGHGLLDPRHLRALVVSTKGPPSQFAAKQEEFRRRHGFPVFHCHPNEEQIRKHLA